MQEAQSAWVEAQDSLASAEQKERRTGDDLRRVDEELQRLAAAEKELLAGLATFFSKQEGWQTALPGCGEGRPGVCVSAGVG